MFVHAVLQIVRGEEKRQALYTKLQQIENRDCPFLYTVEQDRIYAGNARVSDFAPNSQGKYSFENVWLKAK